MTWLDIIEHVFYKIFTAIVEWLMAAIALFLNFTVKPLVPDDVG